MKRLFLLSFPVLLLAACASDKDQQDPLLLITKEKEIEQLYKIDENGNIVSLLSDSGKIANPSLSPDRTKLAYMSENLGSWDVHIYDIESGESQNVTNSPDIDGFPSWSPDGSMIAYMSAVGGNRDIFISKIDGSNRERITNAETIELEPIWSPSGKPVIYFKSVNSRYEGLFSKDLTSGETIEIGATNGGHSFLRQVPEQNQISYIQNSNNVNSFMLFDEGEMQNYSLLETPSRVSGYAWSPDGKQVAIAINGQLEVYDYTLADGLALNFIIENAAYPAWSKSGTNLYYNKRINSILQLFKLNIKTGKQLQITNTNFDSTDALPY